MANLINIETKQHKKEHFIYLGEEKIAVHPLGPDMSQYQNEDVTIYALRGWYYISHEDKAKADSKYHNKEDKKTKEDSGPKPRIVKPGF